jgi:hypothetical protein
MGDTDTLQVGLEAVLRRFDEEESNREALDTKATLILGFASALAGLLFNGLINLATKDPQIKLGLIATIMLVSGFGFNLFAILFSLGVVWIRQYSSGPGNHILLHASQTMTKDELQKNLIEQYGNAFEQNRKRNGRKAEFLRFSFILIVLGTVFMFLALFVFVGSKGIFL